MRVTVMRLGGDRSCCFQYSQSWWSMLSLPLVVVVVDAEFPPFKSSSSPYPFDILFLDLVEFCTFSLLLAFPSSLPVLLAKK